MRSRRLGIILSCARLANDTSGLGVLLPALPALIPFAPHTTPRLPPLFWLELFPLDIVQSAITPLRKLGCPKLPYLTSSVGFPWYEWLTLWKP